MAWPPSSVLLLAASYQKHLSPPHGRHTSRRTWCRNGLGIFDRDPGAVRRVRGRGVSADQTSAQRSPGISTGFRGKSARGSKDNKEGMRMGKVSNHRLTKEVQVPSKLNFLRSSTNQHQSAKMM